ncbi:MAG: 6-bladed beta-propeller [Porphyromonadaceae bacterium]|nr:MAG: 6-bladed beta-propeller [Porphyromonadaceae bacterium]
MKYPITIITVASILFVLLASCANRESGMDKSPEEIIINIDDKNGALLNVSIKDVIPLETSQNSLIGYASQVKYFNHRFYLIDKNRFQKPTFFVFDEKGKFVWKTIQGKGPGEVIEPYAFAINEEDSVILLHDQALSAINTYDLNGNFIYSKKHPNVFIKDFYHINRDTFLVYNCATSPNPSPKGKTQFLTYTLFTNSFTKEKHFDILLSNNKVSMDLFTPVFINRDEILFVAPWNYNIYHLVGDKERIRYHLSFGKYNFSSTELATLSSDELREQINQGSKVGSLYSIFKTNHFLVFIVEYNRKLITFFQSIKNKKIYSLNDCIDSGLIPFCFNWGIKNDSTFYGLVEPEQLVQFQKSSDQFKELDINDNDNPYIIIFSVSEL